MSDKKYEKKRDPNDVPLGDGLADRARKAIKSRRQQLDEAIDGKPASKRNR